MEDRKVLFDQFADAQNLVTQAGDKIRTQKAKIASLARDGKDTTTEAEALAALLKSYARCVATRDQIREQLSFR